MYECSPPQQPTLLKTLTPLTTEQGEHAYQDVVKEAAGQAARVYASWRKFSTTGPQVSGCESRRAHATTIPLTPFRTIDPVKRRALKPDQREVAFANVPFNAVLPDDKVCCRSRQVLICLTTLRTIMLLYHSLQTETPTSFGPSPGGQVGLAKAYGR
jgi:hypothetical protein